MRVIELAGNDRWVRSLTFAPDGRTLFALLGRWDLAVTAVWYDLAADAVRHTTSVAAHRGPVRVPHAWCDAAVSPDLGLVARPHSMSLDRDYAVVLERAGTPLACSLLMTERGHPPVVPTALVFSGEGRWLAAADASGPRGRLLLWEVARVLPPEPAGPGIRRPVLRTTRPYVPNRIVGCDDDLDRLAASPEGAWVVGVSRTGGVHRVPLPAGRVGPPDAVGGADPPAALAAGAGGRVAVAHGGIVWRSDGDAPARPAAMPAPVSALAFHPNGRVLAVGLADGRLSLLDLDTLAERAAFAHEGGHVGAVAFSPDGLTVAAGGAYGRIAVWDVDG